MRQKAHCFGASFASEDSVMASVLAAVRQIASGLGRRAERFCLVYESQLVDTNGFAFIQSAELSERDVIDRLIEAGYGIREALRLMAEARLFFAKHLRAAAM